MISNPVRFESRYRLYRKFARQMHHAKVNLWTVEVQTGDRPFAITDPCNPRHIQLRHWDELWIKENALNIGISKLPDDWETVAWVDADIEFVRKNWGDEDNHEHVFHEHHDWVTETLHQLQIYKIVQMFETAVDLGPSHQTLSVHKSFMSQYIKNGAIFHERRKDYCETHPGFAWAARREAIDDMGGLLDRAILGAGDRHMCLAFVGKAQLSFHPDTSSAYQQYIMDFQDKCEKSIRRDVGFVPGTILHYFHGKKRDRHYWDRWQILVKNQYQPYHDVKPNSYGILQLHDDHSPRFLRLRDEIRAYFRSRNEDSVDLE
jgi:hypothetical protein